MSCVKDDAKPFHTWQPTAPKFMLPKLLCLCGMLHIMSEDTN